MLSFNQINWGIEIVRGNKIITFITYTPVEQKSGISAEGRYTK